MRTLYLSLAALFFGLAVLGAVLPVLPTTPFLLLTSWCLVRSSPTLHARLRRSPLFGPLITDWEAHHGVRLHVKLSALGMLAVAVGLSLWLGELATWLKIVLIVLALFGAAVILRLKTIRPEPRAKNEERRE
ncbi:MAG: YbaN family protein [Planctomycetes bacterium]|nr:YbaN family protein [Planctomycetota bacterium]